MTCFLTTVSAFIGILAGLVFAALIVRAILRKVERNMEGY
jgi:hypothetical protein